MLASVIWLTFSAEFQVIDSNVGRAGTFLPRVDLKMPVSVERSRVTTGTWWLVVVGLSFGERVMTECQACHKEIDVSWRFCRFCGAANQPPVV